MAKKYVVDLTDEERTALRNQLRGGKAGVRRQYRSRILLLADEGATDEGIARALHLGKSTVERTRRRFVEGGLERALTDRPRPGKPRMLNGKQEAFLVALACSDPPEERAHWTMQLLADRLIELGIVESITDETVRRTLKKTTLSPGRRSSGVSRR
jgi:transposase